MQIISVNVGQPREVAHGGKLVTTSIFKEPVQGPRWLRRHNVDGDRQSDLSVHGGPDKAAYAYPSEHYPFWQAELGLAELGWASFGENFTTAGLDERELQVGDRLRLGRAVVRVTEPRVPCYKLGIRFGRSDMVKRFLASRRSGFYVAVEEEGQVEAGDPAELLERAGHGVTVADLLELYAAPASPEALRRALAVGQLPAVWRQFLGGRLEAAGG